VGEKLVRTRHRGDQPTPRKVDPTELGTQIGDEKAPMISMIKNGMMGIIDVLFPLVG